MKDTLDFYAEIYEPLFRFKNYNLKLDRGDIACKMFSKKVGYKKIKRAIDVGCAWGKTLKRWKDIGINGVGVDVSPLIIKTLNYQNYQVYIASATDLSIFRKNSFDLYMATDVYEHLRIEDLEHAINEAKRITKRYIVIRPRPVLDKRGRKNIKKALHLTVWDLEEWEYFFNFHNLKIIKIGKNGETAYKNVFIMKV